MVFRVFGNPIFSSTIQHFQWIVPGNRPLKTSRKNIMARIPCPDSQTLESLLSGRLPYPQLERLAQHLEGCPDCSHRAASLCNDDPLVSTISSSVAVARDPDQSRIDNLIQNLCQRKS